MNKKIIFNSIFICLLAFSTQAMAGSAASEELVNKQKYQWVIEEVLLQLKDLKKDINGIKKNLARLDNKIETLAKRQPTRPNKAPAPKTVKLGPNRMGSDKAKYAIIEFSDYQCPFCARHSKKVLPTIKKELIDTGQVLYSLRDYPLSFHKEAEGAAVVAHCAGEQGKYWEMHDRLFTNIAKLNAEFYQQSAENIGLDKSSFDKCLESPEKLQQVQKDIAYGNSLGVNGTPRFYIGKLKGDKITQVSIISGAQSYSAFKGTLNNLGLGAVKPGKLDK